MISVFHKKNEQFVGVNQFAQILSDAVRFIFFKIGHYICTECLNLQWIEISFFWICITLFYTISCNVVCNAVMVFSHSSLNSFSHSLMRLPSRFGGAGLTVQFLPKRIFWISIVSHDVRMLPECPVNFVSAASSAIRMIRLTRSKLR